MMSYFDTDEYNSIMYMYHILIIHSFVGRHLGCFHYDYETISMNVQIPLIRLRVLCIDILRRIVVESYGSLRFFFFRTFNTNFYGSCVSLHSQQHWIKYLFYHVSSACFIFMLSLLTGEMALQSSFNPSRTIMRKEGSGWHLLPNN